jgi:predicted transcriptional regulator
MSKTELKNKIAELINNIEDEDFLELLLNILSEENRTAKPYQLSAEELSAIEKAEAQIASGQFITHEQAMKQAEEWLRKK